jgi:LysR family glycine cleavage system transcriptional activator
MNSNTPPLNALRAFEAAARHGSFKRAGVELHVTAAAISHQVKELEKRLGISLFERLPRGVALTDAGARYRDEIARGLEQISRATANLGANLIEGPLRISALLSFSQLWLAPRLNGLSHLYPDLELSIVANDQISDLRAGEADVGIRFGTGDYPGYRVEYLCSDMATCFIATEQLARLPETAARYVLERSVLLHDKSAGQVEPWMAWPPWLREARVARSATSRSIRLSDSALAISACLAGAGVCIGRLALVLEFVRRRQLVALAPWRTTDYAYYVVSREADADDPRLLAFVEWLRGEIRNYAADAESLTGCRIL